MLHRVCRKNIPVDDKDEESDSNIAELDILLEEENISDEEDGCDEETSDDCSELLELKTPEDGDDVELNGLDEEDLVTSGSGDDVEGTGLDEEELEISDDVERTGLEEEEARLKMRELDKLEEET